MAAGPARACRNNRVTTGQLPLRLPLEAATARDDLVVSLANASAVEFLDAWPRWPVMTAVVAGPTGAGKSHLAQIWAARADARFLTPGVDDLPSGPGAWVVEDLARGAFSEQWLFHLLNAVRAHEGHLLLTSRRWPGDWGIALPDLASRMRLAHVVELHEPDDTLLHGVLVKLFSDRQLAVAPNVIDYLAMRMERSLASAQRIVEAVDGLSLSEQKPATRAIAARALEVVETTKALGH